MSILDDVWCHYDASLNSVKHLKNSRTRMKIKHRFTDVFKTVRETLASKGVHHMHGGFDENLEPQVGFSFTPQDESEGVQVPSFEMQICTMIDYEKWGRQNVVVGPEMQEAFADTELGKVPSKYLKFPFPAYWIALPGNEDIVCWGGTPETKINDAAHGLGLYGTGWHSVKGAYVIARDNCMLVHMWAPEPQDKGIRERIEDKFNVEQDGTDDWGHTWFSFRFNSEQDIEQALIAQFENPDNEIHDPSLADGQTNFWGADMNFRGDGDEIHRRVTESAVRLLRIIINSALYMTSPKPDLKRITSGPERHLKAAQDLEELASRSEGRAARKLRREAENKRRKAARAKSPVVWIGPQIEAKLNQAHNSGERQEHSKRKGHVRKGHWHPFRTGAMKRDDGTKIPNEERGRIFHWIPPTWCGDLDTKQESQTYAFREV